MAKWQKVYETASPVRAEIIKGVLATHGIIAVILNKKESVYQLHGNYEVMTSAGEAMEAINIIENGITF